MPHLVEFALCAIQSTQLNETKTPLTLAPSRGSLGVLSVNLFRHSCGTVLAFNPEKRSEKHTGTRMSRHTDPSWLDANTDARSPVRV